MSQPFHFCFPLSCGESGAAAVWDVPRVSCHTGGVGVIVVMWLLWSVFMAAVIAGHTLYSLRLNEYGKACRSVQQRREQLVLVFHSWLPSDSLFSCSLNCQTACILSEKVTTLTCVKLMLTAAGSHMIDISDMLRIIIISLRLLPAGVATADHLNRCHELHMSRIFMPETLFNTNLPIFQPREWLL